MSGELVPFPRLAALLALALPLQATAATDHGRYVAFVTCPTVRDTPVLPCWMARKNGTLYYLGVQSGRAYATTFFPPQLKHKVLVEGRVTTAPKVCGGVPLTELHVSALPELSPECDRMLPNAGFVSPPGRSPGADPALPAGMKTPSHGPQDAAPVLYDQADIEARAPKSFTVLYTFDSDFAQYPLQQNRVVQAQAYARAIGAKQIRVTAYRGASLLGDGTVMVESPLVAGRRAANIHAIFRAFDVPEAQLRVIVLAAPAKPAGENDYLSRRVQIDVVP